MQQPRPVFFSGARPARAKNGGLIWQQLGLHKKAMISRMAGFGARIHEHHLSITGQFQMLIMAREVGDGHAAQFDIVFGRDGNPGMHFDLILDGPEFRHAL